MASDNQCQSLALLLPMEVKSVESYVTWLEELAEHVEKSTLSKSGSLDHYLKLILEEKKAQQNEDGNEDEDSDWCDNIGHVAMKMNEAAMYTYVGDYGSAKKHLEISKNEQLDALNLTDKHNKVIIYFRDSLAWVIGVLRRFEEEKTFLIKGASKLNCRWEELTEDEEDNQIKATLAFLKACLSTALKVPEEVSMDLLFEATNLDPDCFIYFHYAYRVSRRIRRNLRRNNKSALRRPSEDEEGLAKRAFKLCPNDVVILTDYALMLKETLWMESTLMWEKHEDDYLKCVEHFEKALRLATETGSKKWCRKIKVYLAEFLAFGKGPKLDQDAGKRMFDELAIEYPTSTFVLHKVGKLYHHGLNKIGVHDGKCVDFDRAKECYLQAIESNPGNYACLMDYLKLLRKLKHYREMISAIDKALKNSKRDYQVAKLKIAKGYITWIWNPLELQSPEFAAVDMWLFVLKNLPEFSKDVYYSNDLIYFDLEHPAHVVKKQVMEFLEGVKMACSDEEELLLYENFVEELSKYLNRARKSKSNWSNDRKSQAGGDRGDELTEKMKGLRIYSHANRQNTLQGSGTWKNKRETFAGRDRGEELGRQPRRPKAFEDKAWGKRD